MNAGDSKYIERKKYRSRYAPERITREPELPEPELSQAKEDLRKFIPFLRKKCKLEFSGRILEIGAGAAWLSAELSRLPKVVEVIATDFSPRLLQEQAPKTFQSHKANPAKITRTPGDFHELDFRDDHFDFVVCSAALYQAVNMVQVLREVKRVLKPGGYFVAIREPVAPLMQLKSRKSGSGNSAKGRHHHTYALGDYRELFKQAALPLRVEKVNLSSGFKYYIEEVINGLTHARYAFIGRKRGSPPVANRATVRRRSAGWARKRSEGRG